MPLYDYRCNSCGNEFDDMHSMKDRFKPETLPCTKCSKTEVMLKMAAPALCSAHRISGTASSQPGGDFKERMKQIKTHFKRDKHAKIPDF